MNESIRAVLKGLNMKKLFYLVLVVLIVLVIGSFVKTSGEPVEAVSDEIMDVVACDCEAECTCDESDENCACAIQRSACDCDAIANGLSDEIVAEEVVEENPEETSHEDETIVSE